MRKKLLAGIGFAATVALAAPHVVNADPVEPDDACHYAATRPGPEGWVDFFMACDSIQDSNEMVRGRLLLHRRKDGFRRYLFTKNGVHGGSWTSCNNFLLLATFDTDVWVWVSVVIVDEPDTLVDGC